jgi:anti-sigma regulatory factor (Ser/Thr protein kinase)
MTTCRKDTYRSTLHIGNDPTELETLTRWIMRACSEARLSERTAFAVQLCLEEVVANILEHGKGSARAAGISARLERSESEITLDIEDDGGPFDPNLIPPPPPSDTLDTASVGGQGIHLVRQFSSRLEYDRSDGRNRLRLTFAGG